MSEKEFEERYNGALKFFNNMEIKAVIVTNCGVIFRLADYNGGI